MRYDGSNMDIDVLIFALSSSYSSVFTVLMHKQGEAEIILTIHLSNCSNEIVAITALLKSKTTEVV